MPAEFPPDIGVILRKPGAHWTDSEMSRMKTWLNEKAQRPRLVGFARRLLGKWGQDHAEDAWQEYCVRGLESMLRSFHPARGSLWGLLYKAFLRFCWRMIGHAPGPVPLQIQIVNPGPTPAKAAEQAEEIAALRH